MVIKGKFEKGKIRILSDIDVPEGTEVDVIIPSTASGNLLKHAGTWKGNDADDIIRLIYDTRNSTAHEAKL
jgi:predicted DNA-binding antitoxin AbrB/MazE fold protein